MKFLTYYPKIVLAVIGILIVVVPYIILFFILKSSGKKLQITPSIKVVDIKSQETVESLQVLKESVDIGKQILAKVKK